MMHRTRRWGVSSVATAEELAHMLSERTWTLCSGFFVAGHEDYLFVSDATSEDGAGEYAVLRGRVGSPEYVQLESITFSWCTFEKALIHIQDAVTGRMDGSEFATTMALRVETVAAHRRCRFCE